MEAPDDERDGGSTEDWREADGPEKPPATAVEDEDALGWRVFVYDVVSSVLAVLVVGAYLYAVSGVWPPLVAVESRSMTPNMQVNDLVFVMETDRFPGPGAHGDSGVVTARAGSEVGHRTFGRPGDVIVYERDGNERAIPIIHRAMFWVEAGENWYDRADKRYIDAEECGDAPSEALTNCPAPHAGFITKGDNNGRYDQVTSLSRPVRPEWVVGTAEVRVPGLGWIRLQSAAASGESAPDRPVPAMANRTGVPAG
jgi:signal peptidase